MKRLKKWLLYGSLDRETYRQVRPRIREENRKSINVFTLIGMVCFLFTAAMALIGRKDMPVSVYFIGSGIFILMYLINRFCSKRLPVISDIFAILYSMMLMAAGVFLAYSQSGERTTLLLPFFTLVSLVFCYRPIYLMTILICTEIAFLWIMHGVQPASLFFTNSVNTGIFCFVGMVGGFYTLFMKYDKYKVEHENQVLLERDPLTGLYNRYSWKNAFHRIAEEKATVTICSLDVNGLKQANDSKGHLAGDELIQGAALCLKDVFGPYGNIYRVGGDEFCALIFEPCDEECLRRALSERTKAWKGELNEELSIALGVAGLDAHDAASIERAIHAADLQMYEEKRNHYRSHDRRQA